MLKIQNVSKTYSSSANKAVDNLVLEVKPGEIFGFLGPNGAGKSTTIKMIAGILTVDGGRILVDGLDVVKEPMKAKLNIGYVSDSHETFDRLTGIEYLNFMSEMYEVESKTARERINRLVSTFQLTDAMTSPIKSYSHGMKQKIVVIGALLHKPKLWILDEPLTGLDPAAAYQLKLLMHEHVKEGNTVFFSSHVIEVVEKLCHRIAIINKGKLVTVGTLEEVKKDKNISLEQLFLQVTDSDNAAKIYGE